MMAVLRERYESLGAEEGNWRSYFEELFALAERYKDAPEVFPPEVVAHVKKGYQRVLFAEAYMKRPEKPLLTKEDWDRLPDRWFD